MNSRCPDSVSGHPFQARCIDSILSGASGAESQRLKPHAFALTAQLKPCPDTNPRVNISLQLSKLPTQTSSHLHVLLILERQKGHEIGMVHDVGLSRALHQIPSAACVAIMWHTASGTPHSSANATP